ncbi:MAG: M28 family metallopeptidase [Candidatus Hodarchaeota archaeon]
MAVEITKEQSDYMYNFIKEIIDKFGPRNPCTPAEKKAAEHVKKELEKSCDEAVIEPFKCVPRGLFIWIPVTVTCILISMLSFIITYMVQPSRVFQVIIMIIAVLLVIIGFYVAWQQFFNYNEFLDKLFKEKESQNVIGTFKAKGERKRIILFSAHLDSAFEFNLSRISENFQRVVIFTGFGILLVWFVLSIISLFFAIFSSIPPEIFNTVIVLVIMGIPIMVFLYFFISPGERANVVPGAIDDLSGISTVMCLSRYLKEHDDIIPDNTEIRLIAFGCEEAGLRGAYRYAARHRDELLKYDAELVNMDGLELGEKYHVLEFEPTTRTRHSPIVVDKIMKATEFAGVDAHRFGGGKFEKTFGFASGGSDAAAFSKAGVKAASMISRNVVKSTHFYHLRYDTIDNVDPRAMEGALKMCIAYLMNEKKGENE